MPIRLVGIIALGFLLVCLLILQATGAEPAPDRQVVHVLNRLAFGPTLEDFRRVKAGGIDRYIAEQLDPDSLPEPLELGWRLAALDTLRLNAVQLRQLYGPLRPIRGFKPSPELVKAQRERARVIVQQAAEARILRAVLSQRQLQEVMVDFWYNHFNVFAGKDLDDLWIGDYEQRAIRPFALGRFRDLLFAVTKHPAMLVYLDNTLSTAPANRGAGSDRGGLNENFAREVMELHTLGADGGYTQEDVVTLARVLTGWRVNRPDAREFPDNAAVFEGARHDFGVEGFPRAPVAVERQSRRRGGIGYSGKEPGHCPSHRLRAGAVLCRRRPAADARRAARRSVSGDRRQYPGGAEDRFQTAENSGEATGSNTRRPISSCFLWCGRATFRSATLDRCSPQ